MASSNKCGLTKPWTPEEFQSQLKVASSITADIELSEMVCQGSASILNAIGKQTCTDPIMGFTLMKSIASAFLGPHIIVGLGQEHSWRMSSRTWGGAIADSGYNKSGVIRAFKNSTQFAELIISRRMELYGFPKDHEALNQPPLLSQAVSDFAHHYFF